MAATKAPSDLDSSFVLIDGEREIPQPSPGEKNPPYAHNWSSTGRGDHISIHGRHFVDAHGRVCQLRGVNLSGNCKTPVNHDHDSFPHNHEAVTFVGRPFPIEEAPQHLARLRRWGLTFVRFLVTWEAIEHRAPGEYDTEYLAYVRSLLSLFPEYGISAFVAMHQDVWSRYSGGSGAPSWTLEAVGFDLHALEESGAAWLKGMKGGGHTEDERGLWPCGYQKLAAATMATCFWAGDTFAPKLTAKNTRGEEVSIQAYLQGSFLDMWELLAKTVGDLPAVIGFEMMNEPHRGYLELQSMHKFDYNTDLHLGHVPTAFQSFMLGAGYPTLVPHYTRSFPMPTSLTSQQLLNTSRHKAWRDDGPTQGRCLWEMHGVWGWDRTKKEGVVLRESYFVKDPTTKKKIDWYTDFYYPLINRWADRVRTASSTRKIVFVEPIPNEFCPSSWTTEHQPDNMVYAPHWYDLNALFAKAFGNFTVNVQGISRVECIPRVSPPGHETDRHVQGMFPLKAFYWGHKGARDNFSLQIRNLVEASYRSLGERPVIIGECGVPMDMNKGDAFKTEEWTSQSRMMDAMITGLERSLVGFTLWNYNPDNDDHRGDDWNGENFSWFSRRRALPASLLDYDQTAPTLDNGGRILRSVVRPYPAKTAGVPLKFDYDLNTGDLTFRWIVPSSQTDKKNEAQSAVGSPTVDDPPQSGHPLLTSNTTEIYLPSFTTHGSKIIVGGLGSKDSYRYDESVQTLYIVAGDMTPGTIYQISVSLNPRLKPIFSVNDLWSDFGHHVVTALGFALALLAYFVTWMV